jgi:transcriptional regulator with PAS, ATPase and Fis domain
VLVKNGGEAARPTLATEVDGEASVSIIGESPAIRQAIERARRAAVSPSTVLLLGESGTGKEVFAHAMHAWSPRRRRPFVVVNCAALSEELVVSELFGHERGAFTGAHQRRLGKLEVAAGGTVFLDEIGEMSPTLQTKLLRVLEDHAFERVGGAATIQANIRVIAATNRDLGRAVQDGRFREDLFFRLNVIPITLPPLRERRSDITLLAESFLKKLGEDLGRPGVSLSPEAREALVHYDWPGNVRELHNLIERAAVLSVGDAIGLEDLALPASAPQAAASDYHARLDSAEKDVLLQALRDHGGNKRAAARALGIALSTLYEWLRKHRIPSARRPQVSWAPS